MPQNIDDWGNGLLLDPASRMVRLGMQLSMRPSSEMSMPPDLTLEKLLDPPTLKIDQWLCILPEFHR